MLPGSCEPSGWLRGRSRCQWQGELSLSSEGGQAAGRRGRVQETLLGESLEEMQQALYFQSLQQRTVGFAKDRPGYVAP